MRTFEYNTQQLLPIDMNAAWKFFSSPKNLVVITPPSLDFNILSDLNGMEIYTGMIIDYKVKPLFGIPVKWQTEITAVEKPNYFIDTQLKGPYTLWEHHHHFIQKANGILAMDRVRYSLPFGILGDVFHSIVVRRKIESIFEFRRIMLEKIFGVAG
jgi:ligand-binding SRPBCC domain-containing protein